MGLWVRFKSWVKRGVVRLIMRVARSYGYRYVKKIVKKSIIPLSITAAGAGAGAIVASGIGFSIGPGALIGGAAAASAYALTLVFQKWYERRRVPRRKPFSFSVLSRKKAQPREQVPIGMANSSSSRTSARRW